jgi:hypothetical protein
VIELAALAPNGGKKRSVMLVNFFQLMDARWLRRLSDLSQRHRVANMTPEEYRKAKGRMLVLTRRAIAPRP